MKTQFLNVKGIKDYFKSKNKQVSKEAVIAIDRSVQVLMDKAITNSGQFIRVKAEEVNLSTQA